MKLRISCQRAFLELGDIFKIMKNIYLVVLVIVFFNLLSSDVYGKDYYVAQKHEKASDDNSGSMSSPWKTTSGRPTSLPRAIAGPGRSCEGMMVTSA